VWIFPALFEWCWCSLSVTAYFKNAFSVTEFNFKSFFDCTYWNCYRTGIVRWEAVIKNWSTYVYFVFYFVFDWHCWLGSRKGIRPVKKWLMVGGGHCLVRMEWRPRHPAGWSVSASFNLPLHHKVQKFCSGTGSHGWSRKKGRKMVVVVIWGSEIYCSYQHLVAIDKMMEHTSPSISVDILQLNLG